MTDPANAFNKPGQGRHYRHPVTSEEWISVTNVLDTCVSKPQLKAWAAKVTAQKAWQLLPRMVALSRKPVEQDALTKELKGEHLVVSDKARDLGDRVHKRVEAHLLNKPFPEDEEAEPFAIQAIRFFEQFGVDYERDVEATEATVINREHGYAGTGDLWLHLKLQKSAVEKWPGLPLNKSRFLILIDYKTSTTRDADSTFPEMGLQVGALAHGEKLLLPDGEELDPPGPIDGAAVLNLREMNYELIPMPHTGTLEDAYRAFASLVPAAKYLHSCYRQNALPTPKPRMRRVA